MNVPTLVVVIVCDPEGTDLIPLQPVPPAVSVVVFSEIQLSVKLPPWTTELALDASEHVGDGGGGGGGAAVAVKLPQVCGCAVAWLGWAQMVTVPTATKVTRPDVGWTDTLPGSEEA